MVDILETQKKVKPEIIVLGFDDWRKALPSQVEIDEDFEDVFGSKVINTEEYLRRLIEINSSHSYERGVISLLLQEGYELDELIVECVHYPEWGKMAWLKEHPAYEGFLKEYDGPEEKEKIKMNFYRAMFMTEHAGEQEFTLYSVAINATGLHKSLIYHKVVFTKESD